jgi:DeoR/GlpR family transcriptional regulator of sugar metabolism
MLSLVRQRPGLRRPDLMAALNVSESTVARCLREMRASVEFRGPSKTGGYFIKEGVA